METTTANITPLANHILAQDRQTLKRIGECAEWHDANPPFNYSIFVSELTEIVARSPLLRGESRSVALLVAAKIIERMEEDYTAQEMKERRNNGRFHNGSQP